MSQPEGQDPAAPVQAPPNVNHPDFMPPDPNAQPASSAHPGFADAQVVAPAQLPGAGAAPPAAPAPESFSVLGGKYQGTSYEEAVGKLEEAYGHLLTKLSSGEGIDPYELAQYMPDSIEFEPGQFTQEEEPQPQIPLTFLPQGGEPQSIEHLDEIAVANPRWAAQWAAENADRMPDPSLVKRYSDFWFQSDPTGYMDAWKASIMAEAQSGYERGADAATDLLADRVDSLARQMMPDYDEWKDTIYDAIDSRPWLLSDLEVDDRGVYTDTGAVAEKLLWLRNVLWAEQQAQAASDNGGGNGQPQAYQAPVVQPPQVPVTTTRSTAARPDVEDDHKAQVRASVLDANLWARP